MKVSVFAVILIFVLLTIMSGCKPNDADIQTKINHELKESPDLSVISVSVSHRVVTLGGSVENVSDKNNAVYLVNNVHGVDSVINNITTETPPAPSSSLIRDEILMEEAGLILKNYPGITGSVSSGIITLTGTINANQKSGLFDTLKTLSPRDFVDQLTIR